jgi:DNA damage-binding protein 1
VDPEARVICVYAYEGVLKVIRIEDGAFADSVMNLRLREFGIIDMAILPSVARGATPVIGILHEDAEGGRHFVRYEFTPDSGMLSVPFRESRPLGEGGADAHALIPVPGTRHGVLIAGGSLFEFVDASDDVRSFPTSESTFTTWTAHDSSLLLADAGGRIHKAVFGRAGDGSVTALSVEVLGTCSIASALCVIGQVEAPAGTRVFVGSGFGDSQLIRLLDVADESADDGVGSHIMVEDVFESLGPIVDMEVIETGNQGQSHIVTCSGAYKDGSLRVVRNGVGVQERAVVPLKGIRGLWCVRETLSGTTHSFMVHSYASETRVFALAGGSFDEVEPEGFSLKTSTLACGNIVPETYSKPGYKHTGPIEDAIVQVTSSQVRLIAPDASAVLDVFTPPGHAVITSAALGDCEVLIALSGRKVVHLTVGAGRKLVAGASTELSNEVSSLSISPFTTVPGGSVGTERHVVVRKAAVAAVGCWEENSMQLLAVPSLSVVPSTTVTLSRDFQSRSAQLVTMDGVNRLFVGMGDGSLVHFVVSPVDGSLESRKTEHLGTRPVTLSLMENHSSEEARTMHLLVSCDRPAVVSSHSENLVVANVNAGAAECMIAFSTDDLPAGLALATTEQLTLGVVDDIQKLHIETVPLGGEQPRRITHVKSASAVVVATLSSRETAHGDVVETSFLRLFDDSMFELLDTFELEPMEHPLSLTTVSLQGPDSLEESKALEFVALGTAFVLDDEDDPSRGRLLLFQVAQGDDEATSQFRLVASHDTRGGVWSITSGIGRLFAGINSRIAAFSLSKDHLADASSCPFSLEAECSFGGFINVLNLSVVATSLGSSSDKQSSIGEGAYVDLLVGDMIKSVTVIRFSLDDHALVEIARDPSTCWTTAVAGLSETGFIGCDSSFNLFTVQRNIGAMTDEERGHLVASGSFHLGDQVNRFKVGSLVMLPPEYRVDSAADTTPAESSSSSSSSSSAAAAATATAAAATTSESSSSSSSSKTFLVDLPRPKLLFGTVSGTIGAVLSLPAPYYHFLKRVELAIAASVPGVGGLTHETWRSWQSNILPFEPLAPENSPGFVDGDLIERLLEFPPAVVKTIASVINAQHGFPEGTCHKDGQIAGPVTPQELVSAAEELSRLH